MDTGSPTVGFSSFQFGDPTNAMQFVDPNDVFMQPDAIEQKPTHNNLFFSYP